MFGTYQKSIQILHRYYEDLHDMYNLIPDTAMAERHLMANRASVVEVCIALLQHAWKAEEKEFSEAYAASMQGQTVEEYLESSAVDVMAEWNKEPSK